MAHPHIDHERLCDFAAGELTPINAWKVRRHLWRCAKCRAERARIAFVWTTLAQPEPAAPGPETWAAIAEKLGDAHTTTHRPKTITIGGYTMSKASAVIAAVAAVTIVTGAVAARLTDGFDFRARMTFSDHQQRQWRLKTSSDVKIELDDPSGVMFAQGGNEETPRASAVPYVDVQVGGFQMAIRGMGRHEIRDANGNLLGSIVLSDWNAQERTQNSADAAKAIPPHDYDAFVAWAIESEKASGGIRGVATMGPMAWGHDEASGLFWCARGLGTIAVPWTSAPTPLEPIAPEASAVYPTLKFTPEELATPRLTVIVDGKRADYQGYGAYAAPIRDGKTVKFTMEKPRG